ncbi:hypothetical protein SEA_ELINAL_37 [Gordonia phage Elinal]|nr:hypothetical protein SEA_ELINAL_37 [Gordonia phage Elinal]
MNRNITTPTADCDLCDRKVQDVYHDDETGLAICDRCYNKQAAPAKGTKQVHRSHAACDHPSTPAARAKCRKARAAADNHFGDTPMQDEDNADVWENLPRDLFDAYEALTDKQKEQARARIADNEALPAGAKLTAHVAIALADRARFKKTTIAKLSKADVRSIIALALS